ncbi:basic amino acid ABC transporter substrate-binding protein [Sutterella sp.]|uniref:basic amino acid ABC transporter substrate-binding protein n=1 Tax=Sutterella sp. TaxID=1981025 RepID=UPI0026DFD4EF|nr:basic amino acid ABC transporter substrate-binding protein [Sutterella sp.]MDO5531733.1 basic amino acid ABC transporter substrate-binding protein [Sutterella sp.]
MQLKKLIVCACAIAACGITAGTAAARDLIRVGTEPTFAPFEFLDTETKEFTGFDMDLIRAVVDKAGYDVQILNMGFDALVPAVMTGTIDVIAAGLSITPERAKRVDFTAPYYTSGVSMLIAKKDAGKYKTFDDLKNRVIAVQIGTTGAEKAKDIAGAQVKSFNTTSEAFMDLMIKGSDAVLLDRPVLGYYLRNQAKAAQVLTIPPYVADAEEFGFAVKKGNKELLDKLNKAYADLKASGEVQKIYDKWFQD